MGFEKDRMETCNVKSLLRNVETTEGKRLQMLSSEGGAFDTLGGGR
jgi:hypothetical protein